MHLGLASDRSAYARLRTGHWLSPPPSYQIYSTIFGLGIEAFPELIDRLNALGKEIQAAA